MTLTAHQQSRAEWLAEREARTSAYLAALAERDELATLVAAPEADDFDRRALSQAETWLKRAAFSCNLWDGALPSAANTSAPTPASAAPSAFPIGAAETPNSPTSAEPCAFARLSTGSAETPIMPSTAPARSSAPLPAAGAVDSEVEAIAARICASDMPRLVRHADAEVEAVAARICASDEGDGTEAEADAIAARILAA
jgi:hypothetical protein